MSTNAATSLLHSTKGRSLSQLLTLNRPAPLVQKLLQLSKESSKESSSDANGSGNNLSLNHSTYSQIGDRLAYFLTINQLSAAETQRSCAALAKLEYRHDGFFIAVKRMLTTAGGARRDQFPPYALCNILNAFVRLGYHEKGVVGIETLKGNYTKSQTGSWGSGVNSTNSDTVSVSDSVSNSSRPAFKSGAVMDLDNTQDQLQTKSTSDNDSSVNDINTIQQAPNQNDNLRPRTPPLADPLFCDSILSQISGKINHLSPTDCACLLYACVKIQENNQQQQQNLKRPSYNMLKHLKPIFPLCAKRLKNVLSAAESDGFKITSNQQQQQYESDSNTVTQSDQTPESSESDEFHDLDPPIGSQILPIESASLLLNCFAKSNEADPVLFDLISKCILATDPQSLRPQDICLTLNAFAKMKTFNTNSTNSQSNRLSSSVNSDANSDSLSLINPRLIRQLLFRLADTDLISVATGANLANAVHAMACLDQPHGKLAGQIEKRILGNLVIDRDSIGVQNYQNKQSESNSKQQSQIRLNTQINNLKTSYSLKLNDQKSDSESKRQPFIFNSAKEVSNIAHGYARLRLGSNELFIELYRQFETFQSQCQLNLWDAQSVAQMLDVKRKKVKLFLKKDNNNNSKFCESELKFFTDKLESEFNVVSATQSALALLSIEEHIRMQYIANKSMSDSESQSESKTESDPDALPTLFPVSLLERVLEALRRDTTCSTSNQKTSSTSNKPVANNNLNFTLRAHNIRFVLHMVREFRRVKEHEYLELSYDLQQWVDGLYQGRGGIRM